MTKAYSTEIGVRAVNHDMQAHGAMGFTNEIHTRRGLAFIKGVECGGWDE